MPSDHERFWGHESFALVGHTARRGFPKLSLADACRSIGAWRLDYNRVRPHSSLGDLTPEAFAEKAGLAA